jgi:two-component system CheB/CheR fusion protein
MASEEIDPAFEELLGYLKRTRGFDFTGYKRSSLQRRIAKRMDVVATTTYSDYTDYLEVHPDEFVHLFNTILINVTGRARTRPRMSRRCRRTCGRSTSKLPPTGSPSARTCDGA